ncbi:phage terminase small subunit P27 family [Secundilactobacillus kimchicus]|uniref:phage terminase small subunit P27 family n=1 Tax=Secundilactobacillus kimchicus TaxID=528209 RepID=UPI002078BDBE|nr:phage terminase small subunit P27 family [Secundilactobacillus kimchicus]
MVKKTKETPETVRTLTKEPPSYLKGIARNMWRRIVPMLLQNPVVNQLDKTLVEDFCVNYQLMRDAYIHVQENGQVSAVYHTTVSPVDGKVVAKDFVGYKRNPSTQIIDQASTKLKQIGAELGLSPKSRAELLEINNDDGEEVDLKEAIKQFT